LFSSQKYTTLQNWAGADLKTAPAIPPFISCFTGSYGKTKKFYFFVLNTIVKILISWQWFA